MRSILNGRAIMAGVTSLVLAASLAAQGPCGGLPSYLTDFDSALTGTPGTYPGGWKDGGGNISWWVHTGGTSSSATGPAGDHTTGSGNYIFLESSSPVNQGDTAIIEAPVMDVTGIAVPTVEFWYSMNGTSIGDLYLEVWDGAGWNPAWTLSGDQGLNWLQASVPVTPVGTELRVRFRGVDGNSFRGDMALDDVTICGQPLKLFQVNSAAASMSINGNGTTSQLGPAAGASLCNGFTANIDLAVGTPNIPFEIAIATVPTIERGFVTANNQVVNLDLSQPLFWLNGVTTPLPVSFPGSSRTLPVLANGAFNISAQMITFDPTAPDGFDLSGAVNFESSLAAPSIPGPIGDDSALEVVVGAAPLCGPGYVNFYGTSYTSIFVSSNGRVNFVGPDSDFGPSAAEVLTDNPFVGCWADLSPQRTPGGLVITANPVGVSVDFTNVEQFGAPFGSNTFSIQFDFITDAVTINNMALDPAGTANMLVGITNGNLGATDPGAAGFAPGLNGLTGNASDALYDMGTIPTFSGLSSITFFPNGFGNYDWAAL